MQPGRHLSERSTGEITEFIRTGLGLWFNMDYHSLAGLLEKAPCGEPDVPQLQFLRQTLKDTTSPEIYDQFYSTFLFLDDLDALYACTGAAIGSIWAGGRDFHLYEPWLSRTDFLLQRIKEVSPLAIASLLGYKALAELTGKGNLDLATMPYTVQQHWAEKSGSVTLRLLHASTAALCSFWAGDITSAELLLNESLPLSNLSQKNELASLLYQSCLGLCRVVQGDTDKGLLLLEHAAENKVLRFLPLSISLHLYTNYLYGLCISGNLVQVQHVADIILEKTIPPCNYYHLACVHFCLGVAALRLATPRKALLHSEAAVQRGVMCGSAIVAPFAALIRGRALVDMDELEQALEHFASWLPRWQEKGFGLFAATGSLEMTAIYLHIKKLDMARTCFAKAEACLPQGERLMALYRDNYFVRQLEQSVRFDSGTISPVDRKPVEQKPNVIIQVLGTFCVTINGEQVYDRLWKGRRSQQLLKAIISLGGTKVSLEKLSYNLWPDSDGDHGMNNLKTALSRLRRVGADCSASPNWLVVKHRRVSLVRSCCRVDALEFLRKMENINESTGDLSALQLALALYKNDFLPNDNEPWVVAFRDQLRKLFIEGVLRLSSSVNGEKDTVLAFLEQASLYDPLHEGVYAGLMEHYINAGYPAYALDIFQKAEKIITLQTGLQSGPRLYTLAMRAKNTH